MPYVDNAGDRIYYKSEGDGPALVLLHPFTLSLESWRQLGYVEVLSQDFQLVLVDLRGHGGSDKPRQPRAYALEKLASDVLAVLGDLDIQQTHVYGYGLGSRVGLGMSFYNPERVQSLIAGGQVSGQFMAEFPVALSANDDRALTAINRQVMRESGFEESIGQITGPTLIYAGQLDPFASQLRMMAAAMPQAAFVQFDGLDQTDAFVRSDVVLPRIRAFLSDIEQQAET